MLFERAIVYERIFCIDLEILMEHIIHSYLILGVCLVPFSVRTIKVIACLSVDFLLYYRRNGKRIETVGLVSVR